MSNFEGDKLINLVEAQKKKIEAQEVIIKSYAELLDTIENFIKTLNKASKHEKF